MIKGTSEVRQLPRLGKIRTGIKAVSANSGKEYPKAVDYFVCPPEVQAVFGEKPKSLDIMFPVEDPDVFASQWLKCYSSYRGRICKGDGEKCIRLVDLETGDFANRETKSSEIRDCACSGRSCPQYAQKKCREVLNLQFLLPRVPGLGVWQLDTSSYHGIVNINSTIQLIKSVCGRVSMIPLQLTLEPQEVQPDGVKKTVQTLHLRFNITLMEMQKVAQLPPARVLLPSPDEEKPDELFPENGFEEDQKTETCAKTQTDVPTPDPATVKALWPDPPGTTRSTEQSDKDFNALQSASKQVDTKLIPIWSQVCHLTEKLGAQKGVADFLGKAGLTVKEWDGTKPPEMLTLKQAQGCVALLEREQAKRSKVTPANPS